MSIFRWIVTFASLIPFGWMGVNAQTVGSLDIQVKNISVSRLVKNEETGKDEPKDIPILKRKRFYIFSGGLAANEGLVNKLKAAKVTSRECFYCNLHASKEYIEWLRSNNCESPYCRRITTDDIAKVPEFQAAFQKGVNTPTRNVKLPPRIAEQWVTTNLAPELRDGFYRQQKNLIGSLLAGVKPLQSTMTDSGGFTATFVGIPLSSSDPKVTQLFTISNLVPFEFEGKSYVWICEVSVGSAKTAKLPFQKRPDVSKKIGSCEVIVRQLPACSGGVCSQ